MRKTVFVFTLFVLPFLVTAQVKTTPLGKGNIPPSIKYAGKVVDAITYTDNEGEHIIITTQTGILDVKSKDPDDDGLRKSDLYAYAYLVKNGITTLSWQLHDLSGECPVDPKASYIPKTFAITDLDKNGKAEVWLMYSVACRGDVSPADMKIIMHEGVKKFAVRGQDRVKVSATTYDGGKYAFDEAFKKGPEVFRKYAENLWKKNIDENWKD